MLPKMVETYVVELPEQATVLLNPLRAEILSKLSEPASAAEVARQLSETPQRINYHLKALEKVGLAQRVGSRQVRSLVEVLYQSIARTFVLSESLGWNADTVKRMKDQGSLSHLITTSERIKRDALLLMEKSDENIEVPSASLHTKIHLEDEDKRKEFVQEYVNLVKGLVQKYQQQEKSEEAYSVVLAVYPELKQEEGN